MITKEKISNILLLIFAVISLLLFLTLNKNKELHKIDIDRLEQTNDSLLHRNDSLNSVNAKLTNEITNIMSEVDSVNTVLTKTEVRLKKIKNEKIKIINRFNNLHADSTVFYFTKYFKNRK